MNDSNLCSKHFGLNLFVSVEVLYFLDHVNIVILFCFKYHYVMFEITQLNVCFFPPPFASILYRLRLRSLPGRLVHHFQSRRLKKVYPSFKLMMIWI